jgi:hypothetical protein
LFFSSIIFRLKYYSSTPLKPLLISPLDKGEKTESFRQVREKINSPCPSPPEADRFGKEGD